MKQRTWRKLHRYLGPIIGIQLLLWTVSGAFFSFNSIRSVRGEDRVRTPRVVDLAQSTLPSAWLTPEVRKVIGERPVVAAHARTMLDQPVLELEYHQGEETAYVLVDLSSGQVLSPIDEKTARRIALSDYDGTASVDSSELVSSTTAHSEYRGKELPAWRIQLNDDRKTAIYVSANRGQVTARRNRQWRWFDWFWMLHTMDYQGRDNFNTLLLKTVSCFGIATVATGFLLWAQTSRLFRRRRRTRPRTAARPNPGSGTDVSSN